MYLEKNTKYFTQTKCNLVCKDTMPYQIWRSLGEILKTRKGKRKNYWWIGDWFNFGQKRYGTNLMTAVSIFEYKIEYKSLSQYSCCAKQIPPTQRTNLLSYAHHIVVMLLNSEEQQKWIDRAIKEKLTAAQLKKLVHIKKHPFLYKKDNTSQKSSIPKIMPVNKSINQIWYIKKTMAISASHSLALDYSSKCANSHGHNWKIIVFCKGKNLDENGMIIDFSFIQKIVNQLDHENLDDIFKPRNLNSTAENIAMWILTKINRYYREWSKKEKNICYKVIVQETEGNEATYLEKI